MEYEQGFHKFGRTRADSEKWKVFQFHSSLISSLIESLGSKKEYGKGGLGWMSTERIRVEIKKFFYQKPEVDSGKPIPMFLPAMYKREGEREEREFPSEI